MKDFTGSHALIKTLIDLDVKHIFGYPGGAIMPVYDALLSFGEEVKHILTRHEQGAIHAAQGYARAGTKVGVVFATSGPGATNLITGLADALIDSTPLLCVTGQVFSHLLGTDAFQETDVIGIATPVTKWATQVTKAEDIAPTIRKAMYIAESGRPGPVLVDITKDAQQGLLDELSSHMEEVRGYTPYPKVDVASIDQAAALIQQAKKPFLVWGQGVILGHAEQELKEFLYKTNIPCASTLLGLSAISTDYPNYYGMVGMHGNYAPNVLTNECDLLIAVGMRFDDRVTGKVSEYAKNAKVIHMELDPSEVDKIIKVDVPVLGDVKQTLPLLTARVGHEEYTSWKIQFDELKAVEEAEIIDQETINPTTEKLLMGEVIEQINQASDHKAIIVSDVGQHQMAVARYSRFDGSSRQHISSGGLGTMGFCLPAAIGAKLACPEKEVVAVIGDGGFQMTIQELGTIMQFDIAVKVVVLNNNFLGMVRQWQQLFFDKRYSSVDIQNPNFTKIVEAYEINTNRITDRTKLKSTLEQVLSSDKAQFLECIVEKEGNIFPIIPTGSSVSDIRLS